MYELKYTKNKHSRPQPTSNKVRSQPPNKIALQDRQPWNNQSVNGRQQEAPSGLFLSQKAACAPVEEEVVVMYIGTLLDLHARRHHRRYRQWALQAPLHPTLNLRRVEAVNNNIPLYESLSSSSNSATHFSARRHRPYSRQVAARKSSRLFLSPAAASSKWRRKSPSSTWAP